MHLPKVNGLVFTTVWLDKAALTAAPADIVNGVDKPDSSTGFVDLILTLYPGPGGATEAPGIVPFTKAA
ncbi:hypothetical protein D3C87_1290110 [compost metagenome]